MIAFIKKLWRDRRGNALVIVAAAMPLVLGSAGLASDTIQWALWKRELQRAADSGAMAGVYAIVQDDGGRTNVAAAVDRDLLYNNHVNYTYTKVVGQPTSGTYASDVYAVQVQVSVQQALGFSGMFLNYTPTITARGTATVVPSGKYCVISLEEAAVTGIDATGSTDVNLGCGMITNSVSMTAAVATGSSSVAASPIAAVGGIPASTHWAAGTVLQPFTVAQLDPFASVPLPTPSGCTAFPNNQPHDVVSIANPTGVKCFNTTMDIKGAVTLAPGTYIMDAGAGVGTTNTGGSLSCTGCTIILMNSSGGSVGTVDLQGGTINMTAPSTGCTLGASGCTDGMLFYQSRNAAADNSIRINGNSGSVLEGALYFPKADITFNGDSGMSANCLQIVAKDVTFTGNSSITNTCPSGGASHSFDGKKVRLVA